ncbi:ParB/RepB/Spo0J family partition protein [Methyloglobulus sp.]|uniref:ParB/RepB/Spo0J family partition protein n=1 Tax=Methyloglobulus sp. TaxID=2518622 RepID=UPI0032B81E1D
MGLDLSALDEKPTDSKGHGKPLEIPVADIIEDPNQPRKSFSEKKLLEMEASIRAKGVKVPISVKAHPEHADKWLLNHGARRLRGSIRAGKETIPAFIDESHDDFDQIIENLQRENLAPMELALSIKSLIGKGFNKSEIAEKLGKDSAAVTHLLTLLELPKCLEDVYQCGKSRSPKTLYGLNTLYLNHPEKVEEWCIASDEITRANVSLLAAQLSPKDTPPPADDNQGSGAVDINQPEPIAENNGTSPKLVLGNKDEFTDKKAKKQPVDNNPLIEVVYKKKKANIILREKPKSDDYMFIRLSDDNSVQEVLVKDCTLKKFIF